MTGTSSHRRQLECGRWYGTVSDLCELAAHVERELGNVAFRQLRLDLGGPAESRTFEAVDDIESLKRDWRRVEAFSGQFRTDDGRAVSVWLRPEGSRVSAVSPSDVTSDALIRSVAGAIRRNTRSHRIGSPLLRLCLVVLVPLAALALLAVDFLGGTISITVIYLVFAAVVTTSVVALLHGSRAKGFSIVSPDSLRPGTTPSIPCPGEASSPASQRSSLPCPRGEARP
jgi:hypothetical protein